jgi:hypothetical protein
MNEKLSKAAFSLIIMAMAAFGVSVQLALNVEIASNAFLEQNLRKKYL